MIYDHAFILSWSVAISRIAISLSGQDVWPLVYETREIGSLQVARMLLLRSTPPSPKLGLTSNTLQRRSRRVACPACCSKVNQIMTMAITDVIDLSSDRSTAVASDLTAMAIPSKDRRAY